MSEAASGSSVSDGVGASSWSFQNASACRTTPAASSHAPARWAARTRSPSPAAAAIDASR